MKVYWTISDGYIGNLERCTEIDDDDLENCETGWDRERLIDDYVQADFDQQVTFSISRTEG